MTTRLRMHDSAGAAANDQVRANVEELMAMRGMTQAVLADRLGESQPWLSKRLTGKTPFQMRDLDMIGDVFGLSPAQLLQEGYGKQDRRCGNDRRVCADRRQRGVRFGNRRAHDERRDGDGDQPPISNPRDRHD